MKQPNFPTYEMLMNPVLMSLKELGGSGTIEELHNKAVELANIPNDLLDILHNPEKGGRTEIEYRLAWTRTYLKIYGVIENSSRGVWSLTQKGQQIKNVDPKDVSKFFREHKKEGLSIDRAEEEPDEELNWQNELLDTLLKMEPAAFERLVQRILRESGFVQVQVTGRSGDGGIDGKGIMRLSGLLSFHVIFQCKRYRGSVPVNQVRDFRGSMVGRADKGLLITTGNFTKDAIQEATRDGAPAIDLIDGDMLIAKLKELSLGIKTEKLIVEKITIDEGWFLGL